MKNLFPIFLVYLLNQTLFAKDYTGKYTMIEQNTSHSGCYKEIELNVGRSLNGGYVASTQDVNFHGCLPSIDANARVYDLVLKDNYADITEYGGVNGDNEIYLTFLKPYFNPELLGPPVILPAVRMTEKNGNIVKFYYSIER